MFEDILERIEEMTTLEEDKEIIYPPELSPSFDKELSKYQWSDFHGENSSPFIIPLTLRDAKIQNKFFLMGSSIPLPINCYQTLGKIL